MATLKSVAFKALTNLAISAAMSALQPQVGGQSGRTFEFVIDPDGPIPFAAGRVGVAGSVIHRDTFGPDLMYYGMPFVLSGAGPITAIESFMADDYPMSFDANGGATTEPYRQELFFRSVLGHQPAPVALSTPSGLKNGATLPGWTAAHKLSGKAAGLIVMAENSKGSAFPTGEIKPLITFRGLKGWDPRQDSTYPGGSGSCRLDDPSTWVYLTNPILWALKWSLGLWEGSAGKGAPQIDHQVGGIGAKLSGIDVPAFVAAANIADANGWTVSAYPNTDDDKHQVLEAFLQAGGAIYSQRAGKISCIQRAAPRTSIVTISAADTAGPLEIDTAASRIDRINTIRPRFWSPAHRWQMTAMDEVTAASYQTEDGGKRTRGIDYPFVSNAKQAGQLAALQIANTREGIAGVIPLKPHLQRIRPGDAFTITEAGFVLNGLKCLCLNTDYDPATGVVRVSFVSETDAKYPFALGQNPTPPTPQVLTPVDPRFVSPPGAGDWTITPRPPSQGGAQQPGFDLTGFVSNETATAIIVETGPSATGPWKQAYQGPPTVTSIPIDGLQPGATYFIAIQYQRNQNYSEREVFGPFTAPALIGDVMPNAPGLSQIRSDIEAAFGDIFDVSALVSQTRTDLEAADAALGSAIGSLDTRADVLETQTQSLEANKASVASLNAQVARVDGVEAVNADQALALVDLENGKVSLSEYNTLKGEVTAARDDAPSLLGQIQNLKSVDLDLQANKASVASVNALTARTSNTEADIIDLESALATETGARAQAISEVSTKLVAPSNEYANADLSNGTFGFTPIWGFGGPLPTISVVGDGEAIRFLKNGGQFDGSVTRYGIMAMDGGGVSKSAGGAPARNMWAATSGERVGFAIDARTRSGSAHWYLDLRWCDKNGANSTSLGGAVTNYGNTNFTRIGVVNTVPGDGYVWAEMTAVLGWDGSLGVADMEVRRATFARLASTAPANALPAYTAPAGGRQIGVLNSSVTQHSLAIIDLENQQALAMWQVKAEATGGRPTILSLISSAFGSALALTAEQIYFGDNTVFDDATDTLRTTVGSVRYVQTWGAPFGPDNLLRWTGPSSVPEGSETKANAGANGAWVDSSGLAFTGGATLSGPFDSGALSATLIGLSAGWTTVATVASKYVAANGGYIFRADWQATLSPKSSPSGAPIYGLNWRVISTNPSGGDVRVVSSGYVTGLPDTANIAMGQPYTLVTGHVSLVGDRKLHLQLALSGTDDVTAASARNARLQGVYYA